MKAIEFYNLFQQKFKETYKFEKDYDVERVKERIIESGLLYYKDEMIEKIFDHMFINYNKKWSKKYKYPSINGVTSFLFNLVVKDYARQDLRNYYKGLNNNDS